MANVTSGHMWTLDTPGTIVAAGTPVTIKTVRAVGLFISGGAKLLDANSNPIFEDCYTGIAQAAGTLGAYGGPLCDYSASPIRSNGLVLQLYSCTGRVYLQVDR